VNSFVGAVLVWHAANSADACLKVDPANGSSRKHHHNGLNLSLQIPTVRVTAPSSSVTYMPAVLYARYTATDAAVTHASVCHPESNSGHC
jgi:hypothetical protein